MASSTSNQLKPCSICNGESCIMIPSISNKQHFCLLHYYSTGQHQSSQSQSLTNSITSTKKKSTSLFVESQRMNKQLPNVQELFAEAFIDVSFCFVFFLVWLFAYVLHKVLLCCNISQLFLLLNDHYSVTKRNWRRISSVLSISFNVRGSTSSTIRPNSFIYYNT